VAGFVLGDKMSWKNVLKETGPKPVEKPVMGTWDKSGKRVKFHKDRKRKLERQRESAKTKDANLFDFGKQEVKDFPVKPNTPTFKIWQAASKEDTWEEFTKEPLDGYMIRDVQKAKKLLQGEVVNIRGTDFKLRDTDIFPNIDAIIERLSSVSPKKTSATNIRGNLNRDIKSLIENKKYAELLEILEGRGKKKYAGKLDSRNKRARNFIQTNKSLRRALLSDSEDKYPEIAKIKKILKIGGVPQVEIRTSISDGIVVDYIKKIMSVANVNKKLPFIYEGTNPGPLGVAKYLFATRAISPSLEFILNNEAMNQSAIPTSYKKRNLVEDRGLKKIINEVVSGPNISVIYDKYKEDIEAFYGRKNETPEQREERIKITSDTSPKKWQDISRKGNRAKRQMFADIRADEDANAEFEEAMSDDEGNPMTEEIRDELVEALEDDSAKNFNAAIKKLGINDKFENMDAVEEEVGDIDKVIEALNNMRLRRSDNTMQALSADKAKLTYFESEKVDAWSVLEDVIRGDAVDNSMTPDEKDGTLTHIVTTLDKLGLLYNAGDIQEDEYDLADGEITSEEFKERVIEQYPKIRKAFLDGVRDRMKDISAEGKAMGIKIPSPEGGFVEPAIWIQISQGVRE